MLLALTMAEPVTTEGQKDGMGGIAVVILLFVTLYFVFRKR